jgi:capsular polysaccharide biosynthesis protein
MELKRYLIILLRRWWFILIALVVAVAATGVFTYLASPKYETTVRLVVSPSQDVAQDIHEQRASLDTLNKPIIANTYAEVAQSSSIVEAAWEQLDDPSAQDEDYRDEFEVVGSVLYDTNIVVLTVTGPNPALVQQLATAVSERTLDYVEGLYETYDLKPLDSAALPDEPISPNVRLNFALGTVLGLGTGVLFAFLAEYLSTPLNQKAQTQPVQHPFAEQAVQKTEPQDDES